MTNEFDFNNENNTSEETSVNGANEVNTTTGDDTNNNFFSSISNETDNNTSDTSSEKFSVMAAIYSQSTYFVIVDRTSEDTEAMKALKEMKAAAKKDGIIINIRSGYRSYNIQVQLYNNYVKNC